MLENPSVESQVSSANIATVKRYAPPNQRNRSLGRRKSGGDRASFHATDVEKNHMGAAKSVNILDQGDIRVNKRANENLYPRLIPLQGCSVGEAFQLLNNRWTTAMIALNNSPEDSVEKPVLYSKKSESAWSRAILPHLLIERTVATGSGMERDFLSELKHAMNNANSDP